MSLTKEIRLTKFKNLFLLMKKRGVSQTKLATVLDIGQASISKWKSGLTEPSIENIIKMSVYFNVSADYLLGMSALDMNVTEFHRAYFTLKDENVQLQKRIVNLTEQDLPPVPDVAEVVPVTPPVSVEVKLTPLAVKKPLPPRKSHKDKFIEKMRERKKSRN
jgi:transcriptional regulator with XRE-family HTH domain